MVMVRKKRGGINNQRIKYFLESNRLQIAKIDHPVQFIDFLLRIQKLEEAIGEMKRSGFSSGIKKTRLEILLNKFFTHAVKMTNRFQQCEALLKKTKIFFREVISEHIKGSKLFYHGLIKPSGFPGDYQILEVIYNNRPISRGFGCLFDYYFLENDYVNVVRDRKNWTKEFLSDFICRAEKHSLRILNLACGGCRELRESIPMFEQCGKEVSFVLVDQDNNAIDFSESKLIKLPANIHVDFIVLDVLSYLKLSSHAALPFDFIYNIGLADYLPDSVLGPLLKRSFNILSQHGELLIAHKNIRSIPAPVADWMCDWKFIPRSKKDLKKLIERSLYGLRYKARIISSVNKLVFYYHIKKF